MIYKSMIFKSLMRCIIKDGKFVKNLNILGRDLDATVIVDNNAEAFGFQPENGILIESWFGDPEDDQLVKLLNVLDEFEQSELKAEQFLNAKFGLKEKLTLGVLADGRTI